MARARNIKPGFFTNDLLAEVEPLGRLLFIGLWTIADREGRLEYRPKRIKAELLPYDECDVGELIESLESLNFVSTYNHGDKRFIQVLNFSKHQKPHPNERQSELPQPPLDESVDNSKKGVENRTTEPNHEKEVSAHEKEVSAQAECGMMNEECGMMNEECRPHEPSGSSSGSPPDCPHQSIIDLYHETCPSLRRIEDWTAERQKLLRTRWREKPERQSLDWWRQYFERVAASDFLCGRTENPFQADLEWLIRPRNMPKVLEGKYDNDKQRVKRYDFGAGANQQTTGKIGRAMQALNQGSKS